MNSNEAAKAEMAYRVMARKDPQTGNPIYCPVVVNGRKVSVEQLLEEVASNGHGIGKVSALKGAYFALMSVVREHLMAGDTVVLDEFARIHCTIRGTVDPSGLLTEGRNEVHTAVHPLKAFQFKLDNFTWRNASATEGSVRMTSITACGVGATIGSIQRGKDIRIVGRNLDKLASVTLTWTSEEGEGSVTVSPSETEPLTLRLPWPTALAEVADGTVVTFTATAGEGASLQVVSRTATLAGA